MASRSKPVQREFEPLDGNEGASMSTLPVDSVGVDPAVVDAVAVKRPDIRVTVLGGYLGAGKTTVLNHVLRSSTERIVVMVNDFGSINIDEDLIAARDEDKITLTNGCICCSLADGLTAALEDVRALLPVPDRLIIEASGVADPASIAAYAHGNGLRLDGAVTLVDAETIRTRAKDKYVGDTVVRQLRSADIIVINKRDLVTESQASQLEGWLQSVNPKAPLVWAEFGMVPLDVLVGSERIDHDVDHDEAGELGAGHRSPTMRAQEGRKALEAREIFESWNIVTPDDVFDMAALLATLATWPPDVVRVKGIVCVRRNEGESERLEVHRVGSRVSFHNAGQWLGGPSRLVVIALLGRVDQDELTRQFLSAVVG